MNEKKKSKYKNGKVKVSLYEGVVTITQLKNMNCGMNILPLGIILEDPKLDSITEIMHKYGNDFNLKRLLLYYGFPKKQGDINILYMQLDLEKLSRDFFDNKLFLDTITYTSGEKKIIESAISETRDLVICVTDKKRIFNRKKNIKNISLARMSNFNIHEYLKEIRKKLVLTQEQVNEIHKRGKVTISEIVKEWESCDLCAPGNNLGSGKYRCEKFENCHDCLIDYASYSLEHNSINSYLKLTNLEDFPPLNKQDLIIYEFYDTEECQSSFFDTEEELNIYINASGSTGLRFKLEFYYNKDGIKNVVKETNDKGEESFYKIIDEETCVVYSIDGNNVENMCKPISLVDWPITDILLSKGIKLSKDKCKIK